MSPKGKKIRPRGVVDTNVLVAGISAFRKPYVRGKNPSADLLYRWADKDNFVWLVTEDILDEYKEILKRLGVRPSLIGSVINLIRERAEDVAVRAAITISPDPKDDPFASVPKRARLISSLRSIREIFPRTASRRVLCCLGTFPHRFRIHRVRNSGLVNFWGMEHMPSRFGNQIGRGRKGAIRADDPVLCFIAAARTTTGINWRYPSELKFDWRIKWMSPNSSGFQRMKRPSP